MATESNSYISALKLQGTKDINFAPNKRSEILIKQDNKCAICKKHLRQYYYKFQTDPKTKEMTAICSDCTINIPKR
jgi:hypothetical protein